jgi:hypothetical protein
VQVFHYIEENMISSSSGTAAEKVPLHGCMLLGVKD